MNKSNNDATSKAESEEVKGPVQEDTKKSSQTPKQDNELEIAPASVVMTDLVEEAKAQTPPSV